jgi:hypothetical protein
MTTLLEYLINLDSQECGKGHISDQKVCRVGQGSESGTKKKTLWDTLAGKTVDSVAKDLQDIFLDPEEAISYGDDLKPLSRVLKSEDAFRRHVIRKAKNGSAMEDVINDHGFPGNADIEQVEKKVLGAITSKDKPLDVSAAYEKVGKLEPLAKKAIALSDKYYAELETDEVANLPVKKKMSDFLVRTDPTMADALSRLPDKDPRKAYWLRDDESDPNVARRKARSQEILKKWAAKYAAEISRSASHQPQA